MENPARDMRGGIPAEIQGFDNNLCHRIDYATVQGQTKTPIDFRKLYST